MDLKRWQQKMFFYPLLVYNALFARTFQSWERRLRIMNDLSSGRYGSILTPCAKNYILSYLEDGLYNVYSVMETSKELCNALEKKYKMEDAGLKKFVAAKFLDFKMVDSMVINEAFQVAAFIEKLPPQWKDFKNYLKHKRKEMTLEDLIVRLRIKEDNKAAEKKSRGNSTIMGATIVEEASTIRNLVGNPREWWIDSGETRHVCANKELFTSYAPAEPNETVFLANFATAKIEGMGKIALKMTSGKIVPLKDVLLVNEMRKNLVLTSLLVKNGFKCVFVSDKVVVSKNKMYAGKGYLTEGLSNLM
ncbi:PREDICTED: uncharacterized protein LOC109216488 [Nicotiana attenuata]|uniref:uncharacterized protein LOC109216488 n=1 Tax=Nicotiana attenuata TaxID=49451 RepID=UPI000905ACA0|nr:PREDICTED: uncharacterized protein LOC109216488 [Nicotiana attenuata]